MTPDETPVTTYDFEQAARRDHLLRVLAVARQLVAHEGLGSTVYVDTAISHAARPSTIAAHRGFPRMHRGPEFIHRCQ